LGGRPAITAAAPITTLRMKNELMIHTSTANSGSKKKSSNNKPTSILYLQWRDQAQDGVACA
jgi:hypothetical protein